MNVHVFRRLAMYHDVYTHTGGCAFNHAQLCASSLLPLCVHSTHARAHTHTHTQTLCVLLAIVLAHASPLHSAVLRSALLTSPSSNSRCACALTHFSRIRHVCVFSNFSEQSVVCLYNCHHHNGDHVMFADHLARAYVCCWLLFG